jgi:methylmalonyl-CoA mutase cobalamin-binding domain/chain
MNDHSMLVKYISNLETKKALEYVKTKVTQDEDPDAILMECRKGLEEVGKKFETGEYFIADLLFVADLFKQIMNILEPELRKTTKVEKEGKIAIATVEYDIHDIGKNLVASMLSAAGFEVHDLGVNVPPDLICKTIREYKPDIVALSCLLTSTIDSMENTIKKITEEGLRNRAKIIVGGIPLTPELAREIGADSYGQDAHEAIVKCRGLLRKGEAQ